MTFPKLEIEGTSIVFLGSFNPAIFQPSWLAHHNLIRKEEAETAKIEMIHTEITVITTDWLRLEITRDKFVASTAQSQHNETIKDLVWGSFHLLSHTPMHSMGINRDVHYRVESRENWHEFGHTLTPKDIWKPILREPGMRSLTMEGLRPDGFKGYIRVRVDPSVLVDPGIYFQVNDHYEVQDRQASQGTEEIIEMLTASWTDSLVRAETIVKALLGAL